MNAKNFFAELKRRNVHKVALVYVVIATSYQLSIICYRLSVVSGLGAVRTSVTLLGQDMGNTWLG
jgi:hypothetical protein